MSWAERILSSAFDAMQSGMGVQRSQAAVMAPSPVGRGDRDFNLSASQGGSWAFKPFTIGDWETNSSEILRAQNLAQLLIGRAAIYGAMLGLPASYVAGNGRAAFKTHDPAVEDLLKRLVLNPANSLLHTPRRDYIRWRMFGMAPYLCETLPSGEIEMNWQDPRLFGGCAFHNRNDALMDWIRLNNTVPFVEGVVELRPAMGGGDPVRIIREPTRGGQSFYAKGQVGVHRVYRKRRLVDSSRSSFDMALLGPDWEQLVDGSAIVLLSNTEGVSLGMPDYIATFDDITRYRSSWNAEIDYVRSKKDVIYKYFFRGTPSPELLKMKEAGWKPKPNTTLYFPFMSTPGDMADLKHETPQTGAYESATHFKSYRGEILIATGLPVTWFSQPEDRVLSALAQESPAVMNLAARQADLKDAWERVARAAIDTARMWRRIPLRADPFVEAIMPPLRAEDAKAHIDRLIGLAQFVGYARQAQGLDPRIGAVILREALATENVIDLERYMRVLGLEPDDELPIPPPQESGFALPEGQEPSETKPVMGRGRLPKVVEDRILKLARKDPEAIAALIPGLRTLTKEDASGNGHGDREVLHENEVLVEE